MASPNLNAVCKDGAALHMPVLEPLFASLRPAFVEEADEICISARLGDDWAKDLVMQYSKHGRLVELAPHTDFHPFVCSSRIRILAGIPIQPVAGTQTGQIRVNYGGRCLDVSVRITLQGDRETIVLVPLWK